MTQRLQYASLSSEIIAVKLKLESLIRVVKDADDDLRWYINELSKSFDKNTVSYQEIGKRAQAFNKSIGVDALESKNTLPEKIDLDTPEKAKPTWVKELYRTGVRCCHPDRLVSHDIEVKKDLIEIYNEIVCAYKENDTPTLMIGCFKVHVKPKDINDEKIQILKRELSRLKSELSTLINSDGYKWSNLSKEDRHIFIKNYLRHLGVRLKSADEIKEVLRRKPTKRNHNQRPVNRLKNRV